jgi:hypothetical protein
VESSLSSREFAANPIGAFFDSDSACDAQKAAEKTSPRLQASGTETKAKFPVLAK